MIRIVSYQDTFELDGIELRDVFAAAALTGLLAMYAHPQSTGTPEASRIAVEAYGFADAMLAERLRK